MSSEKDVDVDIFAELNEFFAFTSIKSENVVKRMTHGKSFRFACEYVSIRVHTHKWTGYVNRKWWVPGNDEKSEQDTARKRNM